MNILGSHREHLFDSVIEPNHLPNIAEGVVQLLLDQVEEDEKVDSHLVFANLLANHLGDVAERDRLYRRHGQEEFSNARASRPSMS